jgi:hypothetical protein
MKYYLILLLHGRVVEINSYDEEDARDRMAKTARLIMSSGKYDEVQTLNEVK